MSYGKNFPIVKKLTFFFHRDEKKNEILEDIFSKGIKKKHKNGEGIRYRMKEINISQLNFAIEKREIKASFIKGKTAFHRDTHIHTMDVALGVAFSTFFVHQVVLQAFAKKNQP